MSENIFSYDTKYTASVFAKNNTNISTYLTSTEKLTIVSTLSILENQSNSPASIPSYLKTIPVTDSDIYRYIVSYSRRFSKDGSNGGIIPIGGYLNESVAKRYRKEEERYGNALPLGGGTISFTRSSNLFDTVGDSMASSLATNISSLKTVLESSFEGKQVSSPQINTSHGYIGMGDVSYPTLIGATNTAVLATVKSSVPLDVFNSFFSYYTQLVVPQALFTEITEQEKTITVNKVGRAVKTINTASNTRLTIDLKQNPT